MQEEEDALTFLTVDEKSIAQAILERTTDSMGPGGTLGLELYKRLSNNELVRQEILGQNETTLLQQTVRAELGRFGDRLVEHLADTIIHRVGEIVRAHGLDGVQVSPSLTCVLLCGGPGRRLWPVTRTIPKVLLPLAGESVLERLLKQIERSHHVSSIIVSTDPRSDPRHQMVEHLIQARYSPDSAKIPRILPDAKEGLGPLVVLRNIAASCDGDLLVVGGDNIFDPKFDFDCIVEAARTGDVSGLAGAVGVVPNHDARYDIRHLGQVDINDANYHVQRIIEKGDTRRFEYVSAACYLLKRSHLSGLEMYLEGEDKPTLGDYLNWVVGQPQLPPLVAFPLSRAWFDMGDVEAYLMASRHYLDDAHQRTSDAIRRRPNVPKIVEPCRLLVKAEDVVEARSIGPYVYLDQDVVVKNSRISNSVVLRGAVLKNADVRDSLIGPGANVTGVFASGVCGVDASIVGPYPEWEAPGGD